MRDSSSEGRDRWCNKAGALDIDGECWFILRADPKDPYLTREIEITAMNSFANYDINIEHVYRNAIACQDKLGMASLMSGTQSSTTWGLIFFRPRQWMRMGILNASGVRCLCSV